jgi:hypothetical protein
MGRTLNGFAHGRAEPSQGVGIRSFYSEEAASAYSGGRVKRFETFSKKMLMDERGATSLNRLGTNESVSKRKRATSLAFHFITPERTRLRKRRFNPFVI